MQFRSAHMWLVAAIAIAAASSRAAAAEGCLSSGDATEIVSSHKVVAPGEAIVLARRTVPNADILRASLCDEEQRLVYRITVLRHDGRVVRVTVDGPSGKLKTVH